MKKIRNTLIKSIIAIMVIICIIIITHLFIEWNRPLYSYKSEIVIKYDDNKSSFSSVASYFKTFDYDINIEKTSGTNYTITKYNETSGTSNFEIDDNSIDKEIKLLIKKKFINIQKIDDAIYFIYRSDWGGAQGIVYAQNPKDITYFNNITEVIEADWYYFLGQ